MSRKENIEKNMEFLIKELQKEWDVSKETKHRVINDTINMVLPQICVQHHFLCGAVHKFCF